MKKTQWQQGLKKKKTTPIMTVPTDQQRLQQLRSHLDELLEKFDFVYTLIELAIERDYDAIAIQKAQKSAPTDLF